MEEGGMPSTLSMINFDILSMILSVLNQIKYMIKRACPWRTQSLRSGRRVGPWRLTWNKVGAWYCLMNLGKLGLQTHEPLGCTYVRDRWEA